MTSIAFITPVWKRHALTAICLRQRAAMILELRARGIEAQAFVVGDEDAHREETARHDFAWVPLDNRYVGRKFNAGYVAAAAEGYDYAMAIGSDSWLDPTQLIEHADLLGEKVCLAMVGLSSFKADGLERRDLSVKYAAGFGVGMVYPLAALMGLGGPYAHQPIDPSKMKGCDTSAWRRCGQGKLAVKFLPLDPLSYLNFTSEHVQITRYEALDFHRRTTTIERRPERIFGDLRGKYATSLVDDIEGLYAVRSFVKFLHAETEKEARLRRRAERERRTAELRAGRGQGRRPGTWPSAGGQGARR